jgi:sterol desaturase/sphingolipid hydroxylase (fatty acid hydroxylase superfamily)
MSDNWVDKIYVLGVPFIAMLIIAEALYSSWRNKKLYDTQDSMGTIGMLLGNAVVATSSRGLMFFTYLAIYDYRLFDLSILLPTWLFWILIFLAIDFSFYCYHRASHRSNILWAIHLSHHCSTEMNFLVSLRQPWLGPIIKIPFFAAIPLIGFDPVLMYLAGMISTFWGVIGHTKVIPRLPELIEFVFNTPSAHRVHHGTNPKYLDKNYGNLLMIWDRMFGTYQREEEEVIFGLTQNIKTQNPIKLAFSPFATLFRQLKKQTSLKQQISLLLRPPN